MFGYQFRRHVDGYNPHYKSVGRAIAWQLQGRVRITEADYRISFWLGYQAQKSQLLKSFEECRIKNQTTKLKTEMWCVDVQMMVVVSYWSLASVTPFWSLYKNPRSNHLWDYAGHIIRAPLNRSEGKEGVATTSAADTEAVSIPKPTIRPHRYLTHLVGRPIWVPIYFL